MAGAIYINGTRHFYWDRGMSYKLYLDDIRNPPDNTWVVIRNFTDALNYVLSHGAPSFVSFDHDLGNESVDNGYDFVKMLVDFDMYLMGSFLPDDFEYTIHSANPVGSTNIHYYLNNYLQYKNRREL